jgi:acyl carrier protein
VNGNVSDVSNRAAIEEVVLGILRDLTADWDTDYAGQIGPDTMLIGDLDFESIDVVELVVSLGGRFARRDLPLEKVLMEDGRYVEDLSVRQVVDFLEAELGGPTWEVFYLNVWLAERGYLAWQNEHARDETGALTVDRLKSHVDMLDWDRTSAFCLTPSSNGVTIRRGEQGGAGISEADYGAFRSRIADELLAWREPETGEAVVTSVMNREDAYPGPEMDKAPDLLITLRDRGFVSILNADRPLRRRPEILGTHRPEGIFLAVGPGIEPGRDDDPLSVMDVTPTILYSLGLPVPSDIEGRVTTEVFQKAFIQGRRVQAGPPTEPPDPFADRKDTHEPALGAEAEAEMVERLKALGYIE